MRIPKHLLWTIAAIVPVSAGSAQLRPNAESTQRSAAPPPAMIQPSAVLRSTRGIVAPVRLPSVNLQTRPIRLLPSIEARENDMAGWTQLTNGAAKGGASVVRMGDGTRLVVRGADDELYMTTIAATEPGGVVDSAAWKAMGFTATSEPNCIDARVNGTTEVLTCAWLNAAGEPTFGAVGNVAIDGFALSGVKGDARPTLQAASGSITGMGFGGTTATRVKLLVRDGDRIVQRSMAVENIWSSTGMKPGEQTDSGWSTFADNIVSSAQCDGDKCAMVNGAGLSLADPDEKVTAIVIAPPPVPGGYSQSAPAPVRLASGTYAVMVRNAQGKLYRITNKNGTWGKWVDEGGTLKTGSSVACIANGEQPLCFAQGLDGRIYWKKLGTAGGL